MEKIIAVFKNRNDAMQFASICKRLGIANKVVNTPRELSVSCGVSVIFTKSYLNHVRSVAYKIKFSSVPKFYLIKNIGGKDRFSAV